MLKTQRQKSLPESRGRGRPTKYDPRVIEEVHRLALLGFTDEQIAASLGYGERTLERWKERYPEFRHALMRGKAEADARVAHSLYHAAIGYSHSDERIFQHEGEIIRAPTVKHYPPDTRAARFWLQNRQPQLWRARPEPTGDEDYAKMTPQQRLEWAAGIVIKIQRMLAADDEREERNPTRRIEGEVTDAEYEEGEG